MLLVSKIPHHAPRKHIMLGIGASDGTFEANCALALTASTPLLYAAKVSVTIALEVGNCHVDDMRNSIVAEFLDSDCDELVFIDEDVGWNAPDLLKLIEHDRDVVGGVYPKKEEPANFPVYTEEGVGLYADEAGLVEVGGLPTGFMKIRRHVLQELWDAEGREWVATDGRTLKPVFERAITEGRRWSHDYLFCRKWIARGGQVYADPSFNMTHAGKKIWAGSLGSFWLEKHGLAEKQRQDDLAEGIRRLDPHLLVKGWNNPDWGASEALLGTIKESARGKVLECGSGLTTLLLAAMGLEVTTLEHDEAHAAKVAWYLRKFDLADKVTLLCRPLDGNWYDYVGGEFDTLVIDGPPRELSDRSVATERVKASVVIWDDYETTKAVKVLEGVQ